MFCYYLQHCSYYFASKEEVLLHIQELSKIQSLADKYDEFLIYNKFDETRYDRFSSLGDFFSSTNVTDAIRIRIWPNIKKRCKIVKDDYLSLKDINSARPKTSNAFLGPRFHFKITELIINCEQYKLFRAEKLLTRLNGNNFANCCSIGLRSVFATKDAINMVMSIGNLVSSVFRQMVELDEYINKYWKNGVFSLADVNAKTNLTISDESNTVKQKPHLRRYRYFNIPGYGGQYCYLHIKIGGLRVHIYPDNEKREIHVPYIGPHLPLS